MGIKCALIFIGNQFINIFMVYLSLFVIVTCYIHIIDIIILHIIGDFTSS